MRQRGTWGWFKHDITHRGVTAWGLFLLLFAFYFLLYFPDKFSGLANVLGYDAATQNAWGALGSKINIFQHFMVWLGGALGFTVKSGWDPIWNKWTLYGALYTVAILGGGGAVIYKYRHNRYQIVRTSVVMLTQTILGFSLPLLMGAKGYYSYYFSYLWPLKIDYFYPSTLKGMPLPLILYSILGAVIMVPLFAALFGKRWYCSWICGCGGLANTFGDPWRQLSDKSSSAWKFERYSIHMTLGLAILTTALVIINHLKGGADPGLARTTFIVDYLYGLVVVAFLSGAVGVAAYPIGGTRIWCRYFCPMAALLGISQKFGRYRITVKEEMCISCGLCSTYCEMGIDVRAYAQRGESFIRASCVGCGLCAEVCPRGVLRLESVTNTHPQQLTMESFLNESYKRGSNPLT